MRIFHAYIEITQNCNLRCRSCYNRTQIEHPPRELSNMFFLKVANRLVNEFSCNRISLSGGEPTLNSEFENILDNSLSLFEHISLVTNGTINCQEIIRLHDAGGLTIQLSLDGSNEKINSITRGKGNFAKTVNFINTLDTSNRIILKMVVSKKNYYDVANFYELALSLGCIPEFSFIVQMGNASSEWEEIELTAIEKIRVLHTIDALNKEKGTNTPLPLCVGACPLSVQDGELSVLIKTSGEMYPCQMLYDEKYCLGNIIYDDISTFDGRMKQITALAQKREQVDFGCTKCVIQDVCKKGCMALAELKSSNPLGDDGECLCRKLQLLGLQ